MFKLFMLLGLVAAVVFGGWGYYSANYTRQQVVDTVIKTERVVSSDGSEGKYLVVGKSETYENSDSIWAGKYDSSSVHNSLIDEKMYMFTVIGYRIPFLRMYRNIVAVEEMPEVK